MGYIQKMTGRSKAALYWYKQGMVLSSLLVKKTGLPSDYDLLAQSHYAYGSEGGLLSIKHTLIALEIWDWLERKKHYIHRRKSLLNNYAELKILSQILRIRQAKQKDWFVK